MREVDEWEGGMGYGERGMEVEREREVGREGRKEGKGGRNKRKIWLDK